MSQFYCCVGDKLEFIFRCRTFASLHQVVDALEDILNEYSYMPLSGDVINIYLDDMFSQSVDIDVDSAILLAWLRS